MRFGTWRICGWWALLIAPQVLWAQAAQQVQIAYRVQPGIDWISDLTTDAMMSFTVVEDRGIVAKSAGILNTNRTLAVFDPTTFPRARPGTPSIMAWIEISSSGAEVPKATIVSDTINAGTPNRSDKFTAPLTRLSPAKSRITKPTIT